MPDAGYRMDGWRAPGIYRLRPTWFGIVIAEELWEHEDSRREWRRARPYAKLAIQETATRVRPEGV